MMKIKGMKRIMAVTAAATMLMSATLMVCAVSDNDVASSSAPVRSTPSEPVKSPTQIRVEEATKGTNANIEVAGKEVKTSVAGVYDVATVQGAAVTVSTEEVKASLGLSEGQQPTIFVYDVDAKKSVNAMASINAAAEAMGTDVVACIQVELGAKESGKWVDLEDGSVALMTGLPKKADPSLTYSVVCVQAGGAITVLEDLDTDPNTVTFAVNAGLGAYAIVAK
ncbi:MAG: hypothetical protein NC433_10055 [Clostridiales bacterium]|nr:hypothetical protein [Clostridiales bacterium]